MINHHIVLFQPRCRDFQISTGNKGVDQLSIKFFSKCGISLVLFSFLLALFCTTGCLEKAAQLSMTPSKVPQDQLANPRLQMDFDVELRSDLFGVRGNIMLPGNRSLAYLMLNATLRQGGIEQFSTKYLLMQIDPNRDYSFEIVKNVKIPAGEYDCSLEAKGPQGVLAEESRRIGLEESWRQPAFEQVPWPVELDQEVFGQENEEAQLKEKSILPKKMRTVPEEIGDKKSLEKEISNDTPEKEYSVAKTDKERVSTSQASLQAPSTLSKEADAEFIGSISSKKYHLLDCRYALKIKPENRIYFLSIEDAAGRGYLPCKSCNP